VANASRTDVLAVLSHDRTSVVQYHLRPGRYILWDFNFLGPSPFSGPHFALVVVRSSR
jgi:hypothetical protein